jgi:hypothetical protein
MDMRTALKGVGIQPRVSVPASLENVIDGLVKPLIKPRKVQVQRAGDFYKARYEGTKDATFGETPSKAAYNLRLWDTP